MTKKKRNSNFNGPKKLRKLYEDIATRKKKGACKSNETAFSRLKADSTLKEILYVADNFNNSFFKKFAYGNPLPKSIEDLSESKMLWNTDIIHELNWCILSIKKYANEINKFLLYKKQFENNILLGKIDDSINNLNDIEKNISFSLWGIESRFLAHEFEGGIKENKAYLNKVFSESKHDYLKWISHFLSIKSEKELSVNRFTNTLEKILGETKVKISPKLIEYYFFRLAILMGKEYKHLNSIISTESNHSIFDKYIVFRNVVAELIISDDTAISKELVSQLKYISRIINDSTINNYLNIISDDPIHVSDEKIEIFRIFDLYRKEKFNLVEVESRKILSICPNCVELYELYSKSLIHQNKEFIGIVESECIINTILNNYYDLYNKNINIIDIAHNLRRIAYNLSSFETLPFSIIATVEREMNVKNRQRVFYPILLGDVSFLGRNDYSSLESKLLERLYDSQYSNDLINEVYNRQGCSIETYSSNFRVTESIYYAMQLQKQGKSIQAKEFWGELLKIEKLPPFIREEIIHNYFTVLCDLDLLDDCINLYVVTFLENPLLTLRFNTLLVKNKIKRGRFKNITHNINLPLFFGLIDCLDYELHIAYECFLNANNAILPTETFIYANMFERKKYIFFLNTVCGLDVFKHSRHIKSSTFKLNERIKICDFLAEYDKEQKASYNEEKEQLTKRLIIQEGIDEVDDSKIYINQSSIIATELKDLESIFNRFDAISQLKSNNKLSILSLNQIGVPGVESLDFNSSLSERAKDPLFEIFKEMFFEIRDKFLFSSYGLKVYFSTRIRHGVLEGELRPEFEHHNLITERNKKTNHYEDNEYWEKKFACSAVKLDKLQNILKEFSRSVDDLINNEILAKYLQIKTDLENPDGWLDYTYDDVYLFTHYLVFLNIKDYGEFVNRIFEIHWERTDKNLARVKKKLTTEIKQKFRSATEELTISLKPIVSNPSHEIFSNIADVQIKIDNKLDNIAKWFNRSETQVADFKMSKVIELGIEYTKRNFAQNKLSIKKEILFEKRIKGEYFAHFVDLIRIFLDNILKHNSQNNEIETNIFVREAGDNIILEFTNVLDENKVEFESINNGLNSFDLARIQKEGKSGFHKAMKILKYDFKNRNNTLVIEESDDREFVAKLSIEMLNLVV